MATPGPHEFEELFPQLSDHLTQVCLSSEVDPLMQSYEPFTEAALKEWDDYFHDESSLMSETSPHYSQEPNCPINTDCAVTPEAVSSTTQDDKQEQDSAINGERSKRKRTTGKRREKAATEAKEKERERKSELTEKQRKRLKANRKSAQESRQRRRDLKEGLEDQFEALESVKRSLEIELVEPTVEQRTYLELYAGYAQMFKQHPLNLFLPEIIKNVENMKPASNDDLQIRACEQVKRKLLALLK